MNASQAAILERAAAAAVNGHRARPRAATAAALRSCRSPAGLLLARCGLLLPRGLLRLRAASAAASSRCSVSREPRLVDAESLGSAAAASFPRCSRTSAWRPEPSEPAAGTSRDPSPPSPGPTRLAFLDSSPRKKWFPLRARCIHLKIERKKQVMGQWSRYFSGNCCC